MLTTKISLTQIKDRIPKLKPDIGWITSNDRALAGASNVFSGADGVERECDLLATNFRVLLAHVSQTDEAHQLSPFALFHDILDSELISQDSIDCLLAGKSELLKLDPKELIDFISVYSSISRGCRYLRDKYPDLILDQAQIYSQIIIDRCDHVVQYLLQIVQERLSTFRGEVRESTIDEFESALITGAP